MDVGCGGGILSEAMVTRGAEVVDIDLGHAPLSVARLHLLESGLTVDYRELAAEDLAITAPATFDIMICMEVLEHVPDPASTIAAGATLVKPGGHYFFSTLNRNVKAYLFAIIGAEYVLNLLPRGTHDYHKFIRPAELAAWARQAGLMMQELVGMSYNPFTRVYSLEKNLDVHYTREI